MPVEVISGDIEIPPAVRSWLIENLDCFLLVGFGADGGCLDILRSESAMHKYALMDSIRRTLRANSPSTVILDD